MLLMLIVVGICGERSYANDGWINIAKKGADTKGRKICTEIIKDAIAEASEKGGGTIFFPAGEYLTGPIVMKSNITLYLDAGAEIQFSDNFDDYLPFVESRWEGTVMKNFSPLIYANGQKNISIQGRGKLNGQGKAWWNEFSRIVTDQENGTKHKYFRLWDKENPDLKVEDYYQESTIKWHFFRPPMIQFYRCSNIRISGVTIQNSPFWTVNPAFSDNITISGITISNPESPNTDGINPTSCRNVHISGCHISVGDDCITIKSGRDTDGRKWAAPCENITITNCTMLNGHGGVVIGSEMSGDVRKVTISNCVFDGTDRGIRLKSARGRGGIVEEIRVDNIVMKNIVKEALTFNLFYDPNTKEEPVSERTPVFRNIHISDLTAVNVKDACLFYGIPEMPIENLTFSNLNIQSEKGFVINTAKDIELHDVLVTTKKGPSFIVENVDGLVLDNVKSNLPVSDAPVVTMKQVHNAFLYNNFPVINTGLFLEVSGDKSGDIYLQNNLFRNVKEVFKAGENLAGEAVIIKE
jgi:polygalacturonase